MTRWLIALLVVSACKRKQDDPIVYHLTGGETGRAEVGVDEDWVVRTRLRKPDPDAIPSPVESGPWAFACDGPAAPYRCGHVYTADFLARTGPHDDQDGRLLWWGPRPSTNKHYAIVEFTSEGGSGWLAHSSRMLVSAGDIIPTPHGRARVGEVRWPARPDYDDGSVTLHYIERAAPAPPFVLHVSTGAYSRLGFQQIAVVGVWHGTADVVRQVDEYYEHRYLARGEVLETEQGAFRVLEVVDGEDPGELGWMSLDTRPLVTGSSPCESSQ